MTKREEEDGAIFLLLIIIQSLLFLAYDKLGIYITLLPTWIILFFIVAGGIKDLFKKQ